MRGMGRWGGRGKGINLIFPFSPFPLSLSPYPVCPMSNKK